MENSANALNWFEIPVTDMDRAIAFYNKVLDVSIETNQMGDLLMGFLPYEPGSGKVSGSLVKGEGHTPSTDGALIYLNGNPDLATMIDRVEAAGGQVALPKTKITDEIGYFAIFIDTEGNKVAFHSQN